MATDGSVGRAVTAGAVDAAFKSGATVEDHRKHSNCGKCLVLSRVIFRNVFSYLRTRSADAVLLTGTHRSLCAGLYFLVRSGIRLSCCVCFGDSSAESHTKIK